VGPNYLAADKPRSVHRLGTVVEALVQAAKKYCGYEAYVAFVGELLNAHLAGLGVSFDQLKLKNPVGQLTELVLKHMGKPADFIIFTHKKTSSGTFLGRGSIKGAPESTAKGAFECSKIDGCKRAVYEVLLEDKEVTNFIESHVTKPTSKKRKTSSA
jgi:hypothetical protein